jgi:hypothetical protein
LRQVEVLTLDDATVCGYCCESFGPDQLALRWKGVEFCTHNCLEHYAEDTPGRDYIASQDQMLAKAHDVLNTKPPNFVLLWDESGKVMATMLAHSEFVYGCFPALAHMVVLDNDVAPPD